MNKIHPSQDSHPDMGLEILRRELFQIFSDEYWGSEQAWKLSVANRQAAAIDAFVRRRFEEFKKELSSVLFPESQR